MSCLNLCLGAEKMYVQRGGEINQDIHLIVLMILSKEHALNQRCYYQENSSSRDQIEIFNKVLP